MEIVLTLVLTIFVFPYVISHDTDLNDLNALQFIRKSNVSLLKKTSKNRLRISKLNQCIKHIEEEAPNNDCDNHVATWRPKPNIDRAMLGIDIALMKPMPLKPQQNPAYKMPIFKSVYQDSKGLFQPYSFYSFTDNLVCNAAFEEKSWNDMESYVHGSGSSSMSSWSLGYQGPKIKEKIGFKYKGVFF